MISRLTTGLINFFLALAEIFLGARIILRFFAADPATSFVHWVYVSSNALLEPLRSIFPTEAIARDHAVDFAAFFAMIVYGLAARALMALAAWLDSESRVAAAPIHSLKKR